MEEPREGVLTVLISCQQHGNEPSGKEAALELARELVVDDGGLLDHMDLILVPQINPDGAQAGTRRNAADADLNRNHVMLSEPETTALHDLFLDWMPEVTLDVHETNVSQNQLDECGLPQGPHRAIRGRLQPQHRVRVFGPCRPIASSRRWGGAFVMPASAITSTWSAARRRRRDCASAPPTSTTAARAWASTTPCPFSSRANGGMTTRPTSDPVPKARWWRCGLSWRLLPQTQKKSSRTVSRARASLLVDADRIVFHPHPPGLCSGSRANDHPLPGLRPPHLGKPRGRTRELRAEGRPAAQRRPAMGLCDPGGTDGSHRSPRPPPYSLLSDSGQPCRQRWSAIGSTRSHEVTVEDKEADDIAASRTSRRARIAGRHGHRPGPAAGCQPHSVAPRTAVAVGAIWRTGRPNTSSSILSSRPVRSSR